MDFMKEYEKWLASPALSAEEHAELEAIKDDPKEIESRFYGPLEFGTAGLRGTMCVGLHQMNVHVIRWATQGFADVIAAEGQEGKDRGVALGGPADDVDVHLVQAHAHGAPQAGGAELQGTVEPGLDLLGIALDGLQLRVLLGGQGGACKPLFVLFHEIHMRFLL